MHGIDRVRFEETTQAWSDTPLKTVPWTRGLWLALLCFVATLLTTPVFGFALAEAHRRGQPLDEETWLLGYRLMASGHRLVWTGLNYSIPLLLILFAHEMGHYLQCRRWHITATLPYFGPSPTLMGTIGAFIWIKSPIFRKRSLLEVGISGPIAGFVLLLPFLGLGIWNSRVCPGVQAHGPFSFGTPLLMRLFEAVRFPGVPAADICLHPMAMAAWAGMLATAINLLPAGQLDGGHVAYAILGERGHTWLSRLVVAAMVLGGFLYWPWWVWAAILFFFRRHPLVFDTEPLGRGQRWLGLVAILMLILSFSVVPVRAG